MSNGQNLVVEGAVLACTGCMDSIMRRSGSGLKVISQNRWTQGGRLIATDQDIGEAILPFPHCDELGECIPEVTLEWIETNDGALPPRLIHGQSVTFCNAGFGVICTITSGQNPDGEALSREDEIELIFDLLRMINDWQKEKHGWRARALSDDVLRQIATDYVDLMRAIIAAEGMNGLVNIYDLGPEAWNAFMRLTGVNPDIDCPSRALNAWEAFLNNTGQGPSQFPLVNGSAMLGLAINQATPNSILKDVLLGGAVLAVFAAGITAPIWIPKAGALIIGAPHTWNQFKKLFLYNHATRESVVSKLNNYLLNPTHEAGRHKAEFFKRALGFTRDNMAKLARQIVFNPKTAQLSGTMTQYG